MSIVVLLAELAVHAEAQLVAKVENAIKSTEPGWRCIRAVLDAPWQQVPSERLLVDFECEHSSETVGKRESVNLTIFQVDSKTDAKMCTAPVRQGKVATGWTVQDFKIGDEGYLVKFRNNERFEITFRKATIFVRISSASFRLVDKCAQLVAAQINAN